MLDLSCNSIGNNFLDGSQQNEKPKEIKKLDKLEKKDPPKEAKKGGGKWWKEGWYQSK